MKKILIISGTDLDDLTNGSTTVLRNYLKYIPKNYEVTVFNNVLSHRNQNLDLNLDIKKIDFLKEKSELKNYLKYFPFLSYSYLSTGKNKNMIKEIEKAILEKQYDLIYFHSAVSYTECYCSKWKGKLLINLIDLYSYAYIQYFFSEQNILKKIFCLKERIFSNLVEKKIVKTFEKVLLVNSKEKDYANKIYRTNKFDSIPIGIELKKEKILKNIKKEKKQINLVFIGNMNFKPNFDGIMNFYNNYFLKLDSNYKLHIIGPKSTELSLKDSRVIKYGFVEDLDLLLANMDFGIAIMNNGGGQKNKILDYLSRGIPVFINDYTNKNNNFTSEYIYTVNDDRELDKQVSIILLKKFSKIEIINSVEKYSAKKSADKFWKLLENSLERE